MRMHHSPLLVKIFTPQPEMYSAHGMIRSEITSELADIREHNLRMRDRNQSLVTYSIWKKGFIVSPLVIQFSLNREIILDILM